MNIEAFLNKLSRVRPCAGGWIACCPAHDDHNPSLSITQKEDGTILVYCHAGCDFDKILSSLGLRARDLFPTRRRSAMKDSKSKADVQVAGLTIDQYATKKRLPVEFLRKLGISQIHIQGVPTIKIPYIDENMEEVAVRFRHSMSKHERRFSWRKGSKPCLYGLWRLDKARKAGNISVVEGESDCHTLWFHGVPAVGVPGASNWHENWTTHFHGVNEIFLVVEPDRGGDAMLAWARKSAIRERIKIVRLEDI